MKEKLSGSDAVGRSEATMRDKVRDLVVKWRDESRSMENCDYQGFTRIGMMEQVQKCADELEQALAEASEEYENAKAEELGLSAISPMRESRTEMIRAVREAQDVPGEPRQVSEIADENISTVYNPQHGKFSESRDGVEADGLVHQRAAESATKSATTASDSTLQMTGWLIERKGPEWLSSLDVPADWTEDSIEAIRFSRRRDAEAIARVFENEDISITEHEWAERAAAPASQGRTDEKRHKLITPKTLNVAWKAYTNLFGEPPHGTRKQMAALIALIRDDTPGTVEVAAQESHSHEHRDVRELKQFDGTNWYYDYQRDIVMVDGREFRPVFPLPKPVGRAARAHEPPIGSAE